MDDFFCLRTIRLDTIYGCIMDYSSSDNIGRQFFNKLENYVMKDTDFALNFDSETFMVWWDFKWTIFVFEQSVWRRTIYGSIIWTTVHRTILMTIC